MMQFGGFNKVGQIIYNSWHEIIPPRLPFLKGGWGDSWRVHMKRLLFVAVVLIGAVLAVSCGKTAVKKTSEDSKTATDTFAVVEAIKKAYLEKDVSEIEKNTTKDGFRAISSVMKSFDSAALDFNPVLVEIEEGTVNLNVSWTGTWTKGGKTTEERGMTVFVLKGMPLKVDAVSGANPFKYPE